MRELEVIEVDEGCDACDGANRTSNVATAFVCGVILGLARDELRFCGRHLAGFKNAVDELEKLEARRASEGSVPS